VTSRQISDGVKVCHSGGYEGILLEFLQNCFGTQLNILPVQKSERNNQAAMTTLYHGTRVEATSNITLQGLQPSTSGRLGSGIYFATLDTAKRIGQFRNNGTAVVVFHCKVNLGICTRLIQTQVIQKGLQR
jgi:hypothetical protein